MHDVVIDLPVLHPGQVEAFRAHRQHRFLAARCGRRWGKTDFAKTLAADTAIKRLPVGWFAPDYKIESEAFNEIVDLMGPVRKSSSKVEGVFRTTTGGRIDFWTLDNERAGRSRMYKLVIIDEAAFTKPNMMDIWSQSIKPTLLDLDGTAVVLSNTNGVDPDNFFWRICNQPEHGFAQFHAPTSGNPFIPRRLPGEPDEVYVRRRLEALEKLKTDNHPLVYQQEHQAQFVDWSGVAFFALANLLVKDQPVEAPNNCDAVFATIDTATKTGRENDGTAVVYWMFNMHVGHPLIILDWDVVQIEGSLLETWLPNVFTTLEALAKSHRARMGSLGAWIEDKASGTVLLQQALRRGWPAKAIGSKLTSVGKDERAISVSGYVYRGMVKLARRAFERTSTYKGATRNHLIAQVVGFRVGDKHAARRDDDLLDAVVYGVGIALGNSEGF